MVFLHLVFIRNFCSSLKAAARKFCFFQHKKNKRGCHQGWEKENLEELAQSNRILQIQILPTSTCLEEMQVGCEPSSTQQVYLTSWHDTDKSPRHLRREQWEQIG